MSNTIHFMGRVWYKSVLEHAQNIQTYHPAHAQSIIRTFVVYLYIRQYPWISPADNEGPGQTARF